MFRRKRVIATIRSNFFIREESLGGFLLIFTAIIAVIWANSKYYEWYYFIWDEVKLGLAIGDYSLKKSLHHWINDGLMAIFFFTIGQEIKREIMAGELSTFKKASLPIFAAIGGMVVPAVFYVAFNYDNPEYADGWGIPMATDIAFALGIISILGKRVNINLKIFLTALAIADDIGAIIIIAIFYTKSIDTGELINAAIFMTVLIGANRLGVRRTTFYGIVGLLGVWLSFLYSGVHATVAGVLIAMTIPGRTKISEKNYVERLNLLLTRFEKEKPNVSTLLTEKQSKLIGDIEKLTEDAHTPLQKLEHALHPLTSYFVLPLFALSNAGVRIQGNVFDLLTHPVALGIASGLLLGKVLGISLISRLVVKLKIAALPEGVTWGQIYGAGFMAGIGFTMSIFIADLAFVPRELLEISKVGIFAGSIISMIIGMLILNRCCKK